MAADGGLERVPPTRSSGWDPALKNFSRGTGRKSVLQHIRGSSLTIKGGGGKGAVGRRVRGSTLSKRRKCSMGS